MSEEDDDLFLTRGRGTPKGHSNEDPVDPSPQNSAPDFFGAATSHGEAALPPRPVRNITRPVRNITEQDIFDMIHGAPANPTPVGRPIPFNFGAPIPRVEAEVQGVRDASALSTAQLSSWRETIGRSLARQAARQGLVAPELPTGSTATFTHMYAEAVRNSIRESEAAQGRDLPDIEDDEDGEDAPA